MRIAVFGLGYVGTVSAGCFAQGGHQVIGVDPNQTKVDLINQGRSPVIEKDIDAIIKVSVKGGYLHATTDPATAVAESDLALVCVGTPSNRNGSLDLGYVAQVSSEIGAAITATGRSGYTVVMRSTMLPGSVGSVVIPALEKSAGKRVDEGFHVCINPEFLREGSAVFDFYHPPKTVIGESSPRAGDQVAQLYREIPAPLIRTDIATAEMVKYCDNVWHALKVSFANEIGNLCKAVGIDSHKAMEIFCQDTKLNLSSYYLKPGFAFGGSCLPKDVRALVYKARDLDLDLPVISAIMPSNLKQIDRGVELVMRAGKKRVGVAGFSFKAGTDDLRESPMVEVIERLIGKGYDIKVFDRNVSLAALVGANREYIFNVIPHIANLMTDSLEELRQHAETLVIGNADPEFKSLSETLLPGQRLIDLVRICDGAVSGEQYEGICW